MNISKMQLDSIYLYGKSYDTIFNSLSKASIEYDNNGYLKEMVWSHYDSSYSHQWDEYAKYEYSFNQHGLLTSWFRFSMDGTHWYKTRGETFAFDSRDSLTEYKLFELQQNLFLQIYISQIFYDSLGIKYMEKIHYNDPRLYINSKYKNLYFHDSNNRILQEEDYHWFSNIWQPTYKFTFSYDSLNTSTEKIEHRWNSITNQWYEQDKELWITDSFAHKISKLKFHKDSINAPYRFLGKWEYYYNSFDSLSAIYSYFNNPNDSLILCRKIDYSYNIAHHLISEEHIYLEDSVWKNYYKMTYNWDNHQNPISQYYYQWDTTYNQWDSIALEKASFDTTSLTNQLIFPSTINDIFALYGWLDLSSNNMMLSKSYYKSISIQDDYYWVEKERFMFYYSFPSSSSFENNYLNTKLKLFPNPAQGFINIETSKLSQYSNNKIRIYNSLGIMVKEILIPTNAPQISINISNLASGAYYVLVFKDNHWTATSKFIKD